MNYEQANSVKELAAPVNKVLEGLDVKCPACKGRTHRKVKEGIWECLICKGESKVKYRGQPKVGEWCIRGIKTLGLISDVRGGQWLSIPHYEHELHKDNVTPILEWEEIERVLEKAGYSLWESYSSRRRYTAGINDKEATFGDSRQEAVMKAVIELAKEIKQ